MFSAYAELYVGTGFSSELYGKLDESADTFGIKPCKGVGFEYLLAVIIRKKFSGIITRKAVARVMACFMNFSS